MSSVSSMCVHVFMITSLTFLSIKNHSVRKLYSLSCGRKRQLITLLPYDAIKWQEASKMVVVQLDIILA